MLPMLSLLLGEKARMMADNAIHYGTVRSPLLKARETPRNISSALQGRTLVLKLPRYRMPRVIEYKTGCRASSLVVR